MGAASGISFPNIPQSGLNVPGSYFDFSTTGLPGDEEQNSLVIGNTVTEQPEVPVYLASIPQAVALFGAGSILAAMVEKILTADPNATLYGLPMADAGGGTAAAGSIAFTGTATANGTLALYIAGKSVPVGVTVGMTAAQLATAAVAAINAWTSPNGVALPVTAAVDGMHTYQVDLTANNKGTPGNAIDIRLNYYGAQSSEATPAGLTVAVVAMTGGATDPTTSGFAAILGSTNYDFIAIPWSTAQALNDFQTLMAGRFLYSNASYGGVFSAKMDADATGSTNIAFGADRNDQHMLCVSYEPAPPPPWEVAACFCGAFAQSSRADPARPTQTLALPGLLAPPATARYTFATQNTLLGSGMALMKYSASGSCSIMRAVTTYQKNSAGQPDVTYKDAETLYTLMYDVRYLGAGFQSIYPRAKIIADGSSIGPGSSFNNGLPDQPVVTAKAALATYATLYAQLVKQTLATNMAAFLANSRILQNAEDPTRFDTLLALVLPSGLRVTANLVQASLYDGSQS